MITEANDFTTDLAIIRYRGDGPISLPLTNPDDGTPFTPTGCALLFTIKEAVTDVDADALVQKSSAVGGITVANPAVVTLVPADFTVLSAGVTYFFDVQAQLSAAPATIRTVARGTLKFAYDITREVTLSISTTTTNPTAGYAWAGIPDKPSLVLNVSAVTAATGGGSTALDGLDAGSTSYPVGCIVMTSYDDVGRHWKLKGSYIAATDLDLGKVKPTNSDSLLNPVHWQTV